MNTNDVQRIARILRAIAPDDAEWVAERLLPRQQRRALREAVRNDHIRAALDLMNARSVNGQVNLFAVEFRRYLASGWLRERALPILPDDVRPLRRLLHRIAGDTGGEPLSPRQLTRIKAQTRS